MSGAEQEVWPQPTIGFTDVYPIRERLNATGLYYIVSYANATGADPGDPVWPPQDAPWSNREFWHYYSEPRGLGGDVLEEVGGLPVFISDNWGAGAIELFRRHNVNETTGFQQKLALNAQWITTFDLSGIDVRNVSKADLVIGIGGLIYIDPEGDNEDWNRLPQDIIFRIDSLPLHDVEGWTPSYQDIIDLPAGSSDVPAMTSHQVINWSNGSEPRDYPDLYEDVDEQAGQNAFPINADAVARIRNGGLVRARCGFSIDTIPAYGDYSHIGIDQDYGWWDDNAGVNIFIRGAYLPKLRLWTGVPEAKIAGDATIRYATEGNVRLPQPGPLTHQARLARDYQ